MNIDLKPLGVEVSRLLAPLTGGSDELVLPDVPSQYCQTLLEFALERSYLLSLSGVREFRAPAEPARTFSWTRICRLPVHPSKVEEYDLLERWQSVLSSLHSWGHRLCFLLVRQSGQTGLYLGAEPTASSTTARVAAHQMVQAAASTMPGMDLRELATEAAMQEILIPLSGMEIAGAITGIPSPRNRTDRGLLQTLDQVAFGIRTAAQRDEDYALIVVAEPVPDPAIARLIRAYRELGTRIHTLVRQTVSASESMTDPVARENGDGLRAVCSLLGLILLNVPATEDLGSLLLEYTGDKSGEKPLPPPQRTRQRSVGVESLDKFAQYAEHLTEVHVERLKRGRNLGFWNTGVYVVAKAATTVKTVTGMLRAVYSGADTYVEPIRDHLFQPGSRAADIIRSFRHLPFPVDSPHPAGTEQAPATTGDGWHPLGPLFEAVTTPLNTEELSLATSLPRRDVPGLRFVRNAVRFATNPPPSDESQDLIRLGRLVDTGVSLSLPYAFSLHSLSSHTLITGTTGSGKSTTSQRLIGEVLRLGIPVLIIEPAKDEYARWAIALNAGTPPEKRVRVFMPGRESLDGTPLETLRINPFEPATPPGATVDLLTHLERFSAVLAASLPRGDDILPALTEEVLFRYLEKATENRAFQGEMPPLTAYPQLRGLLERENPRHPGSPRFIKSVIAQRGYEAKVTDNLAACIESRIATLLRGKRGALLDTPISTDFVQLFNRPAVVNLSLLADDRDKALVMSLLLIGLFEYRSAQYRFDPDIRESARRGRLQHLTVIEEAHRLLRNSPETASGAGDPQGVVSRMFSDMLSEVRAYGQGVVIIDQVPARLIPDAIKNTNLKIVHRLLAADDRQAVASCMGLRQEQQDIIGVLLRGEAVVCGDMDDAASWVRVDRVLAPSIEVPS